MVVGIFRESSPTDLDFAKKELYPGWKLFQLAQWMSWDSIPSRALCVHSKQCLPAFLMLPAPMSQLGTHFWGII